MRLAAVYASTCLAQLTRKARIEPMRSLIGCFLKDFRENLSDQLEMRAPPTFSFCPSPFKVIFLVAQEATNSLTFIYFLDQAKRTDGSKAPNILSRLFRSVCLFNPSFPPLTFRHPSSMHQVGPRRRDSTTHNTKSIKDSPVSQRD
jgi:hypothetical protein